MNACASVRAHTHIICIMGVLIIYSNNKQILFSYSNKDDRFCIFSYS